MDWGFRHKKHFFALTSAGKPIWARYEDTDLTGFTGSLVAIISKFAVYYNGVEDSVKFLKTKDCTVAFYLTEAIWYVCIYKTNEHINSIQRQLKMLHLKIISNLTDQITQTLIDRPNYDAKSLLGGTAADLETLVRSSSRSPGFMKSFMPLRVPANVRSKIQGIFRQHINEEVLFGFLLTPNAVIYKYVKKQYVLSPIDINVLVTLLYSNASLRLTESWTPICLPKFSGRGFLYAYISFVRESNVGVVLISTKADSFKALKTCGDEMEQAMIGQGLIQTLDGLISQGPYPVSTAGIKELNHFIFAPKDLGQYTMPEYNPYSKINDIQRRVLRRYFHAYQLSNVLRGLNYTRIDSYKNEHIICLRHSEYTLLASFNPLISQGQVASFASSLAKQLKNEESSFFILK